MEFTFGIVTTQNTNQYLHTIVNQIRNEVPLNLREIIVVGGTNPNMDDVIHFNFDETQNNKWITKKKNIITNFSTKQNIVYLHDYIGFETGWYGGQIRMGNDFDVRVDKIMNVDGSRYRDWCLWKDDADKFINNGNYLIPYTMTHLSKMMYISGAYWVAKKDFMLKNKLNEKLLWGQGEDVEWSIRCRKKTDFKMNVNSSVKLMKFKDRIFNEVNQNEIDVLNNIKNYNNENDYFDLIKSHIYKWIN